ncbi:cytochrome c biogenesis CcdA family protein [Paenibacillus physcomitrellae]|uniref:Cytochrome C biogenesis protein CcdA n=1 Tax=Paenibacillus physcomitrellae TaxID=1619311 RepID=A0ABQ1GL85_9BACL|nr:cytochrome c biogenesis protein CcdA [Paenibacillus physcomitrellae]GGA45763.1 cytochrome C biogenesis protein CcdA [Paenibacillus physcomitrellae]
MTEQLYVGSVFAAGMLSFFSPCILPLLPVYLAYLGSSGTEGASPTGAKQGASSFSPLLALRTLVFILGLSTVFVLLGFGAGALGSVLNSSVFITLCGIVVILFGLYQTGVVKLPFLERERKIQADFQKTRGWAGAYILGFTFSFGWTPCIGPVLAAVISLSASGGSWLPGVTYMGIYALGLAVPFLIMSLFSGLLLTRIRAVYKHMNKLKILSGVVLMIMGVLLVTNKLNAITAYFQF